MNAKVNIARARRAVWAYGLTGAIRRAIVLAYRGPAQCRRARSDEFDLARGVDTARSVRLEGLAVRGQNHRFGIKYQACEPSGFRTLIGSLPIDYDEFAFIDIGSGKGRALLLASEFPFKRIVGVEFSQELVEISRQNVERANVPGQQCDDFELLWSDAADYDVPELPFVLYFYEPFLEPVMRKLMARVDESLRSFPRTAYVILQGRTTLAGAVQDAGFARLNGSDVNVFEYAPDPSGSAAEPVNVRSA